MSSTDILATQTIVDILATQTIVVIAKTTRIGESRERRRRHRRQSARQSEAKGQTNRSADQAEEPYTSAASAITERRRRSG